MFYEIGVLKVLPNLQENICAGVSFLKEKTPMRVFSDWICKIFKTPSLQNTSRSLLQFYEKQFTSKIVKSPLKTKMETVGKKNNDIRKKNLNTFYYFLYYSKIIYSFFSASHDTLKTRVFRSNAIPLMICLL